ncbi:MAG TPA: 2-phospho-L-lactate guanylyltransferase [Aggregatilinea sp.]|jgi:2-phospho-L-lactate guanylyltransferase|uniref:2-phospho-L-lactate guanylyltransferase n=1 Tax=Aggregatilinea sp. TaxID=2806333 RepID=UPI002C2257BF|nr:2-phospho-L-lactate guanylyltransferase [Aggregatilinea sp.]HML21189.1 2-phospho-L-lactate guanylyltransferase [Aggregatilinea sp.]
MTIWAIVPVKPFNRAKSRLAGELPPEDRELLAEGLLRRTLHLLHPLSVVQGILVISRDTKALSIARDLGAQTLQESGTPELNSALYRATHALRVWNADGVLVVPADLPLLMPEDVEGMVKLARYPGTVVVAPDRHEHGTNLLLVRPPGLIPYSFGFDSFAVHQRHAAEAGATIHVFHSERTALDLDTPEDLHHYYELAKDLGEPLVEHAQPHGWTLEHEPHPGK